MDSRSLLHIAALSLALALTPAPAARADAVAPAAAATPARLQFNRDIRPILSDQCFACHGFDAKKRKAGLRLDTAEGALATNQHGRVAIKPGDPAGSELWRRLQTSDPDEVMPPPEAHKTLSTAQKDLLRRWIEQGAPYQQHWAFEPVVRPAVPGPKFQPDHGHPVDRFIRDRLCAEGLSPSPEAPRETLIRRLSFDLRGLPPTVSEVDRFLADREAGAYGRLVDRFLSSPAFGEQMARTWLDVARYADTHGLHLDNERQMWAYRDWVVRAFNRNLPFDQFTVEQLAGDLLPDPTPDQLTATGFNRCNVTTSEGGSIDAEFIYRYAVERASTTFQTWMGLTAGCAVCHDHKFDPVSQKEFYSFYAFFHSSADPAMDGNALRTAPVLQIKSPEDERKLAEFDARLADANARILQTVRSLPYTDPATVNPPPPSQDLETVWLDDDPPAGARAQSNPVFVGSHEGPVRSGKKSLRLKDPGLSQDVFENLALDVTTGSRLFAHVHLDPANPPRLVMLQFFQGGWDHRAVWGDIEATDWGQKGTPGRHHAGPLPKAGEWVRLEVPVDQVGLKPGEKVTGIAYTQVGGTVHWDQAGVVLHVDPANDPATSFAAWTRQHEGKDAPQLPENIRKILKEVPADRRTPDQVATLREHYLARVCAATRATLEPLHKEADDLRRQRDQFSETIPQTFVWRDLDKPRESFVMVRGQYDRPGERVTRGVPAVFPPLRTEAEPSRLDLARWLLRPEHPLTGRVAVNRVWQQLFGTGLVRTTEDFGSQGEPPSHPDLLDWLAVEFRETGWDMKRLVRLLVTSATYRQSSRVLPEVLARDPGNRLLARGPRFRLEAEQLRDNALFVSGLLDPAMGGKGVKPYQPPNLWEPVGFVGSNTRDYRQDNGPALYRRSLYTFFKRTAPPPFMSTFDAPNREQSCTRRERSNTPLQALQLLNDVQHFEAARGLAERMMTEGGPTPESRIRFGFRTVLSRPPADDELQVVKSALDRHLQRYSLDPGAAFQAVTFGESKPRPGLPEPELAAYTLTANLLLNLDETVNRN